MCGTLTQSKGSRGSDALCSHISGQCEPLCQLGSGRVGLVLARGLASTGRAGSAQCLHLLLIYLFF